MRSIHNENERMLLTVEDYNTKLETADANGYLRGLADGRNQIKGFLNQLSTDDQETEPIVKVNELLKLIG